jgi:hypothetical protein
VLTAEDLTRKKVCAAAHIDEEPAMQPARVHARAIDQINLALRRQRLDPLKQRPGQLLIRRADGHALSEVVGVLQFH